MGDCRSIRRGTGARENEIGSDAASECASKEICEAAIGEHFGGDRSDCGSNGNSNRDGRANYNRDRNSNAGTDSRGANRTERSSHTSANGGSRRAVGGAAKMPQLVSPPSEAAGTCPDRRS